MSREKPRFIAVEGPIGVGKTSLAKRLAETFNYQSLLERGEENSFINRFYRDPRRYALHTQLYFLLQRSQQLSEHRRGDMFEQSLVADYLMDKDNLFAKLNLDSDEMDIYQKVYQHMTINSPVPDMVIYLQAPTGILLDRIKKRGVASERYIERGYLDKLNQAYTEFFHYYDKTKLMIVNSADIDLVGNDGHYRQLLDFIASTPSGTHYFNPGPSLL